MSASIQLMNPHLFGGQFTSLALNFAFRGLQFLDDSCRMLSFFGQDPQIAQRSQAAQAMKNAVNSIYDSPDAVSRVDLINVDDGTQLACIQLQARANLGNDGLHEMKITDPKEVRAIAENMAKALSSNNAFYKAQGNDTYAEFDPQGRLNTPMTNFSVNGGDIVCLEEYSPSQSTPANEVVAFQTADHFSRQRTQKHGSISIFVGAEASDEPERRIKRTQGLLQRNREVIIPAHRLLRLGWIGASNCGTCSTDGLNLTTQAAITNPTNQVLEGLHNDGSLDRPTRVLVEPITDLGDKTYIVMKAPAHRL